MKSVLYIFVCLIYFLGIESALAASLSVSPGTAVYGIGKTFTARVIVNTDGKSINAAEGALRFNPQELSVVSVDRSGSIFNLWVTEPTFSNSAGTISFSGGLPSGYTGASGNVFNVTFRTVAASASRVSFTSGAILANDGKGSNVLSTMNGGTYTIEAQATQPTPEVIEYVAPANTPGLPKISSDSRGEADAWSNISKVKLTWQLPADITSVRTLLDENSSSIPTKVYESPIREIELSDLPEGNSYFHLQFKNEEGWGKVLHYRLRTDTEKPTKLDINLSEGSDLTSPLQILQVNVEDDTSEVKAYRIKVNGDEPYDYVDEEGKGNINLKELPPGYHTITVESFDLAGNSIFNTIQLTISAFDKPVFTDYPNEINDQVIPVIKGLTRPNSEVRVEVSKIGADSVFYDVVADSEGVFTFIPEGTFSQGVYEMSAVATDTYGAKSEVSDKIRVAVQQPGYLQIGNQLISVLSVLIPLLAMLALLIIGMLALFAYLRRFRRKVSLESKEALAILLREFEHLHVALEDGQDKLVQSKKTKKLSKSEEDLFLSLSSSLDEARKRVGKEIQDVDNLVKEKNN